MKSSSEGAQGFQNRLLPIGRRPSGMVESLELRDVVSGMKRELHCLLRENIRLELGDTSDAGHRVKALRGISRILFGTRNIDIRYAVCHS